VAELLTFAMSIPRRMPPSRMSCVPGPTASRIEGSTSIGGTYRGRICL